LLEFGGQSSDLRTARGQSSLATLWWTDRIAVHAGAEIGRHILPEQGEVEDAPLGRVGGTPNNRGKGIFPTRDF
jgi:hypothetical protein